MIKKLFLGALAFGLGAALLTGAVTGAQAAAVERGRGPNTGQPATAPAAGLALPAADPAGLSAAERAGLLYMREEEQLARDVYAALYVQWQLPVFQTISQSEQTHLDALLGLLERYGIAAPASFPAGVFANPDLQQLYTDLVARGTQSVAEALKVGGAIEEIDIRDLDARLAGLDQADLQQVYSRLRAGSENHLRAFANTLVRQTGETYAPQYLSADAYQTLLAGSAGQGAGARRGGGRP